MSIVGLCLLNIALRSESQVDTGKTDGGIPEELIKF